MENENAIWTPPKEEKKCCGQSKKGVTIAIVVISIIVIIAIIVGVTLYFVLPSNSSPSSIVEATKRVDCAPDNAQITQSDCAARGCVYDQSTNGINGAPVCYLPPNIGYKVDSASFGSINLSAPSNLYAPFGSPIQKLKMTYEFLNNATLHMKITDAENSRYEVPVPLAKMSSSDDEKDMYLSVGDNSDVFSFKVVRNSSQRVLMDTSIGGFVFSDQYLQIATYLPNENVYGFGENTHQTLKHDLSQFKTWPMFARDQPPESDQETRGNLYGTHPFYFVMEDNAQCHGVFFFNSNAQEVTLGPGPSLTYRTIGGILDIYVFSGPSPADVISQYWRLIGYPTMPAYWALGFQICKYGYANLAEVQSVVERTAAAQIPQDVQYIDLNYMDQKRDFTLDQVNFGGLPAYMKTTQATGLKWIFIVDPAIGVGDDTYQPFTSGLKNNVYVEWWNATFVPDLNANYSDTEGTTLMLGTVWPDNNTAFPDFFKMATVAWWTDQVAQFYQLLPYDGLWIDMNEPACFGTDQSDPWYWNDPDYASKKHVPALQCPQDNKYDAPPYPTQAALFWGANNPIADKTICMVGVQGDTSSKQAHYDVHNLYGWSETAPTLDGIQIATGKRGVVISRSTYPSSGKYTGHWLGDNASKYADMRTSIIGMMEFNFFGIPYIGADICGFNGNTTEQLCLRWTQLGAFYPFSRNHNTINTIPQDPAEWPDVAEAARVSLNFRYLYLPYLYTLFYKAHTNGETVVRPVFFEFPTDQPSLQLNQQFMWGPAFTVAAVVDENVTEVSVHFPDAVWYDVYRNYGERYEGTDMNVVAPQNTTLPTFVRGGYIVPRQVPALNTTASRVNPFQLLVALDNKDLYLGYQCTGQMFWDDGEAIDIGANYALFQFASVHNDTFNVIKIDRTIIGDMSKIPMPGYFDQFEFLGIPRAPNTTSFLINDQQPPIDFSFNYNDNIKHLVISSSTLTSVTGGYVTWSNELD